MAATATGAPSLDAYERLFAAHGGTDTGYLRLHWPRFRATKLLVEQAWHCPGGRVLDVGAHWLHQSLLFALDGYRVTAADLPVTIEAPSVVALARAQGIRLVRVADLAAPRALRALDDDAFDLVIMGEVIEHLAFNPVELWREIHRVLVAGGRIVVTTPNCHALTRRHLRSARTWLGGGIGVDEILATPTHGHHWKEYSRRELVRYFRLLSPDFAVRRALYVEDAATMGEPTARAIARAFRRAIPPLRERLHVEVDLARKSRGIAIEPAWDRREA
jgi:2-polyprenyl-6-hydroxyphenyl methylase/3-demethylubiquinone-9 3-methyltransferase